MKECSDQRQWVFLNGYLRSRKCHEFWCQEYSSCHLSLSLCYKNGVELPSRRHSVVVCKVKRRCSTEILSSVLSTLLWGFAIYVTSPCHHPFSHPSLSPSPRPFRHCLGKEYTAAVEAKQVAQQEAQRAQFLVEKAVQQRQQKIVQAEGEAEAAYMISFSQPCAVISMYNRQILKSLKQILKWKISHGTNWPDNVFFNLKQVCTSSVL